MPYRAGRGHLAEERLRGAASEVIVLLLLWHRRLLRRALRLLLLLLLLPHVRRRCLHALHLPVALQAMSRGSHTCMLLLQKPFKQCLFMEKILPVVPGPS